MKKYILILLLANTTCKAPVFKKVKGEYLMKTILILFLSIASVICNVYSQTSSKLCYYNEHSEKKPDASGEKLIVYVKVDNYCGYNEPMIKVTFERKSSGKFDDVNTKKAILNQEVSFYQYTGYAQGTTGRYKVEVYDKSPNKEPSKKPENNKTNEVSNKNTNNSNQNNNNSNTANSTTAEATQKELKRLQQESDKQKQELERQNQILKEKAALTKTQTKPTAKTDDFWNTTSAPANKTAGEEEDFWNSTSVPSELWAGKLEQAEQLYTQEKWKEALTLYREVAKINPTLSYASYKVKFIEKLLAYKPEADYIAVRSKNSPNLYGFVNKEGELVINYQFIEAFNFNENLARVRVKTQNGKYNWGYIDGSSNFVIPAIYSNANDFKNAQAEVDLLKKINGRTSYFDTGFIDPSGKWISPPKEKTYTQPEPITIHLTSKKIKRKYYK